MTSQPEMNLVYTACMIMIGSTDASSAQIRETGRSVVSLLESLASVAAAHGDKVAVTNPDGTAVSYCELFSSATRLASELTERGIQPGDRVALLFPRNSRFIEAMLATIAVGAVYVPLDISHPSQRIEYILADANIKLLLTVRTVAFECPWDIKRLETDTLRGSGGEYVPKLPHNPDRVIYSIYTSGSTGVPKGVAITEKNLLSLLSATRGIFDLSAPHVWTFLHSTAFDFSVWEIFGALLFGNQIVCVDPATAADPEKLLDSLVCHQVTFLNQTPSAFYALLDGIAETSLSKLQQLKLGWIVFGGEALSFSRLRSWMKHGLHTTRLVNMYGITETCVHASWHPISSRDLLEESESVIGKPLPGLGFHLLDENLQPVAKGAPGEAWITGSQLSAGYVGRPELTSERFSPPLALSSHDRVYRSGDLMVERQDGNFVYLGRVDNQVSLRGFRVELEEVEAGLLSLPGVQDACAAVAGVEDMASLVAFLAVKPEASRQSAFWREALIVAGRLPKYMIPNHIVCLDAIPLTVNGKKDRTLLLRNYASNSPVGGNLAGKLKTGELRPVIRAAWVDVLGHEIFSDSDNFFDVGGTSLRAVKLFAILSAQPAMRPRLSSLVTLFENATVDKLCRHISTDGDATPDDFQSPAGSNRNSLRDAALERAKRLRAKKYNDD